MTSKNLFPELMREDLKRRLWPLALSFIAALFSLPVMGILAMENWSERLAQGLTTMAEIQISFNNNIAGIGNPAVFFCGVILALICGINSVSYLHNRGKTDLYGSLPVKREDIFSAAYINGLIIFYVPFLIAHIVTLVLASLRGMWGVSALPGIIVSILYAGVLYFSIYTLVCLAAVLSGNTLVSVALSGLILFIAPLCFLIYKAYASVFFRNYYDTGEGILWRYLSPVMTYAWIAFSKLGAEADDTPVEFTPYAVCGVAMMLFIGIIALSVTLILIKKRPAESAGNALSFNPVRPVLKICCMVAGSMLSALLFYEMSPSRGIGWLLFGYIVGILLVHSVVEIVCEFDFKACIRHPLSLIIGAAFSAFLIFAFYVDLFGYDRYLPPVSSVRSAALAGYDLQPTQTYNDPAERGYYIGSEEYRLREMELKDMEDVYILAKKGIEFSDRAHKRTLMSRLGLLSDHDEKSREYDPAYTSLSVRLRLKGGLYFSRTYYVDLTDPEVFDAYARIYETREYKEAVYPVLKAKVSDLGRLMYYDPVTTSDLVLSEKEREKLLRAYRQDMLEFEGSRLKSEIPCARITSMKPLKEGTYGNEIEYDFTIYPSFERSLKFLEEIRERGDLPEENMISAEVTKVLSDTENYETRTKTYENPRDFEKLKELTDCAVRDEFFREACVFMKDLDQNTDGYRVEICFSGGPSDGDFYPTSGEYILPEGRVPDFLEGEIR